MTETLIDIPAIAVSGLSASYNGVRVLEDIQFSIPAGRLCAVVGPNGAGKSTLLKALIGLIGRDSGEVRIFGDDFRRVSDRVAYIPQRSQIDWDFPATALDVATMGLYRRIGWLRPVRAAHREEARACLALVGMEEYAQRQIGQLSGGQQQRVFLARALAQKADLYLMDEPFAGVDAASEASILGILRMLQERGQTVVCVHHNLQTAARYFDHALVVNKRVFACGAVADALSSEALQAAYGGALPFGAVYG